MEALEGGGLTIPIEGLPGALSLSRGRCGTPTCHCREGDGHPAWPLTCVVEGHKRVERWDAEDVDPGETLHGETVRVLRARRAKRRWESENPGVNDGKTRDGMAHVAHHHATRALVRWLPVSPSSPTTAPRPEGVPCPR